MHQSFKFILGRYDLKSVIGLRASYNTTNKLKFSVINKKPFSIIYLSEKIQISNAAKNTRSACKDQINQNVGFFIYNREFLLLVVL